MLAPADGLIVGAADGYADNRPGTNSDRANHVVIDIGAGRYVLMAHLMQGSVTVEIGDRVRRGQPLAAVGNNGHSSEPHLHLQVQDSPAGIDAEAHLPDGVPQRPHHQRWYLALGRQRRTPHR